MTTTWTPPEDRPEPSGPGWRWDPEVEAWEHERNRSFEQWFEKYFKGYWSSDARGGLVELYDLADDEAKSAKRDGVLTACTECGATVMIDLSGDFYEQPHLNRHREWHEKIEGRT